MKIRVINNKAEISNLSQNDTVFHFSFQPSMKNMLNLVQRCPQIKAIGLLPNCHRAMSESLKMYIGSTDIQLFKGILKDYHDDANNYYEVSDSIIEMIKQLKKEGRSEDEIVHEVSGTGKFSEDLLRFIVGR